MKTPNFTPGPWRYSKEVCGIVSDGAWLVEPNERDGEEGLPLVVVNLYGALGGENTEADARLIAAAPAMYEACKAALKTFRHLRDNHPEEWDATVNAETCNAWDKLKAALALVDSPDATTGAEIASRL